MRTEDLIKILSDINISEEEFEKTDLKLDELNRIQEDYSKREGLLSTIAQNVYLRLILCKKVHSVRTRIKNPEHLIAKIIRKMCEDNNRKITIDNYLMDITDLVGVRALHLFKENWIEIHKHIQNHYSYFNNMLPEAKIRRGDSEDFNILYQQNGLVVVPQDSGYRSLHYIIEESLMKNPFPVELQVRTIFEEGYSEIDHTLRYPNNTNDRILNDHLLVLNRLAGCADEMAQSIQLYFLEKESEKKKRKDLSITNTGGNIRIEHLKPVNANLKLDIPAVSKTISSNLSVGSNTKEYFDLAYPNVIEENEDLFINLHLMHEVDSNYTRDLIKEGYLTKDYANTVKAELFIERFYSSKKDLVYNAIKKQGGFYKNTNSVMDNAGINDYSTAEIIVNKLELENRVKNIDGEYVVSTFDKEDVLLKILQVINEGKSEPTFSDFKVDNQFFGEVVDLAEDEGLIKGAKVVRGGLGNKVLMIWLDKAKITLKGIEYLKGH